MKIEASVLDWQTGYFTEELYNQNPQAWVYGVLDRPDYDPARFQVLTQMEYGAVDSELLTTWEYSRKSNLRGDGHGTVVAALSGSYPTDRNVLLKPAHMHERLRDRYRAMDGIRIPVRNHVAWVKEPELTQFEWVKVNSLDMLGDDYPFTVDSNTALIGLLADGRVVPNCHLHDAGSRWQFMATSTIFDVYGIESFTLFNPIEMDSIAAFKLPEISPELSAKLSYF